MAWNPRVKLIISDVDDTISEPYVPASVEIIQELTSILREGTCLYLISGQGGEGISERVTNFIDPKLRKKILLGTCSGAEVWGFDDKGQLKNKPYYSIYNERLDFNQQQEFRAITAKLINEFNFETYPTMPREVFKAKTGHNPLAIMFSDRRAQITFQLTNAYDMSQAVAENLKISVPQTNGQYDLRVPVIGRARILFKEKNLPISCRIAGSSAIDFVVEGVSKTTAVQFVLGSAEILNTLELDLKDFSINAENRIEIWGDKFSQIRGGTDRHICEALPKRVRAIDFRQENPSEFLPGYNIVVWDGEKQLSEGLLEYLQIKKQP